MRSGAAAGSGSPPSRSSAASASSSVATGMISTSSPAISRARAICSSPCAAGTRKWSTPTWRTADTFWASPPIAPDRAVEVDLAGDGDVGAAGEVARRQLVDQRQRERQPGRRPADAAGVDVDLERQLDARRVERDEPDDRPVGSSGEAISSTSTVCAPVAGPLDLELARCRPARLPASCGDEVVDRVAAARRRRVSSVSPGSSTSSAGA